MTYVYVDSRLPASVYRYVTHVGDTMVLCALRGSYRLLIDPRWQWIPLARDFSIQLTESAAIAANLIFFAIVRTMAHICSVPW